MRTRPAQPLYHSNLTGTSGRRSESLISLLLRKGVLQAPNSYSKSRHYQLATERICRQRFSRSYTHLNHARGIEPRASASIMVCATVLAQCHEDMNDSQKAFQLRIMAAHMCSHTTRSWRMGPQFSTRDQVWTFWPQNILCSAKILFIGNMASVLIVTEGLRFIVWIHPMLTRWRVMG